MFSPVPQAPDWLLPAFLGLLFGPYLLVTLAGRPGWARYVVWVQLACLGVLLVRNILSPVPVFGLFVIIYTVLLGLFVLALGQSSRFMAGLVRRHLWGAQSQPKSEIK